MDVGLSGTVGDSVSVNYTVRLCCSGVQFVVLRHP